MALRGKVIHPNGRTDYLFRVSLKAVIFNEEGKVLVVKESGRDWWDIPGGGLDHGESIQLALARELHEEVGLTSEFTYRAILAEDPVLLEALGIYQMRITFHVTPERIEFEAGDDSDGIAFVDHCLYKDSELVTERKIYKYCQLAFNNSIIDQKSQ